MRYSVRICQCGHEAVATSTPARLSDGSEVGVLTNERRKTIGVDATGVDGHEAELAAQLAALLLKRCEVKA